MNENVDPATMREVQPAPPRAAPHRRAAAPAAGPGCGSASPSCWRPPRSWSGRAGSRSPPARSRRKKGAADKAERRRRPCAPSPPRPAQMPITIDALGTVTPLATVTIRTQISGKLMSVGFQEGQLVKTGDFLAQIDPRPYRGGARAGAGTARQGHRADAAGAVRSRPLPDAEPPGFDRQAAGRGPGVSGRAGQGGDGLRPGADRHRQAQHRLHQNSLADQRPRRPAARRSRQLRAAHRHQRARRRHRARPDLGRVLDAGGQPAAHQRAG